MEKCPLCKQEARKLDGGYPQASYRCPTCGDFTVSEAAQMELQPWLSDTPHPRLSAFTREQTLKRQEPGNTLRGDLILSVSRQRSTPLAGAILLEDAEAAFPQTVPERLDRFMLNLARMKAAPGRAVAVTSRDYSIAYAEDNVTAGYFAKQLQNKNWIECEPVGVTLFGGVKGYITVTVEGWARIAELQKANSSVQKDAASQSTSGQPVAGSVFYTTFNAPVGNYAAGSNNVKQETIFNQQSLNVDLPQLARELFTLRQKLIVEASEPEHYVAIGAVQEAQIEAEKNDVPRLQHSLAKLAKVGPWVLDVATKIGTSIASEAIKQSISLH